MKRVPIEKGLFQNDSQIRKYCVEKQLDAHVTKLYYIT